MVNLRCCEIHELNEDKIVESHILIDVMDLMFQTGIFPVKMPQEELKVIG